MRVGVVKEIKDNENRVGLIPEGVSALVRAGHEVVAEHGAGLGCGFSDAEYEAAGAILGDAKAAWASDLVVKVKEPMEPEYARLGNQIVFTYLHLAGVSKALTTALLAAGTTAVAYETVEDADQRRPLLAPMSAVAGSMAPFMGAYYLAKFNRGSGMLLGRLLGRRYGKVVILGDGVVGQHAAQVAAGLGARVLIFGLHEARAEALKSTIFSEFEYVLSTPLNVERHLPDTDLLVGAVLVGGARAPHLVSAEMVKTMPEGSVIVDVSIDQGGCVETSRPTTHSDPVFIEHGVTHYCVTNMPGAYPKTSTFALTAATLPYVLKIAGDGVNALRQDADLARGVNTFRGRVTCESVADALGLDDLYRDFADTYDSAGRAG